MPPGDISRTEARLSAVREWLADREIDCLFVYSYRSALTTYWTGYAPRHSVTNASLLAITARDAFHATRLPLHVATAERSHSPITHACAAPAGWAVATVDDLVDATAAWLGNDQPKRMALAAYGPEAGIQAPLERRFGSIEIVTRDLVERCHAIKDEEDLTTLRRASGAAQEAFDAGVAALHPGATTADAVRAAESVLRDHGSVTWHCFAGGTDTMGRSLLQGASTPLTAGTTAFLEVIPDIDLFGPEVVSTVFIGDVADEARSIYDQVCKTLSAAVSAIQPALTFGDLFDLLTEPMLKGGAGNPDLTRVGHATGLDNIELPEYLAPDDDHTLRPGRVVSIHPNVRTDKYGTIHRGGTLIVDDQGCEPLFSFPDGPIVAS